jgi:hypothetical protein
VPIAIGSLQWLKAKEILSARLFVYCLQVRERHPYSAKAEEGPLLSVVKIHAIKYASSSTSPAGFFSKG